MIIWELSTTNGEETSYRYYAMKGDAGRAKRAFKKENGLEVEGPTKTKISNRDELIALIDKIQGTQSDTAGSNDGDDAADEFL